jgi:hypothetical protein
MRRAFALMVICSATLGSGSDALADTAGNLTRDAQRFAHCMKLLDARCVIGVMHTKPMRDRGASDSEIFKRIDKQLTPLKELGLGYKRFDNQEPWEPIVIGDLLVAFVPYEGEFQLSYRNGFLIEAYLIGVSKDEGATWQFIDGSNLSKDDLTGGLPGYSGQPVPTVFIKKLDQQ